MCLAVVSVEASFSEIRSHIYTYKMYTCTDTYTYTHTHAQTDRLTDTHIHTHKHTQTHTHMDIIAYMHKSISTMLSRNYAKLIPYTKTKLLQSAVSKQKLFWHLIPIINTFNAL